MKCLLAALVAILVAAASAKAQQAIVVPNCTGASLSGTTGAIVVDQNGKLCAGNAQVTTATATVSSGQSLSGALDLGAASLAGLQTPAAMDSATVLTFQVSYDNVTFANYYSGGSEYALTVAPSQSIEVPYADFIGVRAIKIRLGTSASPVTATANRAFTLGLRP